MSSLPIPAPESGHAPAVFCADETSLLQAFRSFAKTANTLEGSYRRLRAEVTRLRGELTQSNAGLMQSLNENRTMREHLDRILDGLPCGVLVVKCDGRIARINPAGRTLVGASNQSAPGDFRIESVAQLPEQWRDLLGLARASGMEQEHCFHAPGAQDRQADDPRAEDPQADGPQDEDPQDEDAQAGVPQTEDAQDRASGRWLAVRYAAVAGGNGKSSGAGESIFILRDVSDAKKVIRERERTRREQALAEISAILAHEIRNPLGSLELFAGLLAASELSTQCRGWVEHVQAGLRTLAATVNNVLHFHCMSALQKTSTDLGSLIDWAEGFFAPLAREAGVELRVANRLHGICLASDRHRLEQVLLNLVLNALRATPPGGRVEIGGGECEPTQFEPAEVEQDEWRIAAIWVSDTGPGLQPHQMKRIFEPGFTTRAGSPGLGLAVCREIVAQHGGVLRAENRAEGGALFTARFSLGDGKGAGSRSRQLPRQTSENQTSENQRACSLEME
jgi:signal transduction histidine kinase